MNDIFFSNSYIFQDCRFKYSHTSNNSLFGIQEHTFAYIIEGFVTFKDGRTAGPGSLIYTPKGTQGLSQWKGNPNIYHKVFRVNHLPTHINAPLKTYIIECDEEIKNKFKNIPTKPEKIYTALKMFYDALESVLPYLPSGKQRKEDIILDTAKKYIHYRHMQSIAEISKALGVSESYLYSTFKKKLGITPNDYRLQQISEIAVNLLSTTDKSLEEISSMLNFSSGAYLRKIIKKTTGKLPSEIRNDAKISGGTKEPKKIK